MKLSEIASVKNPATGGTISLTDPVGIFKIFGGIALFYVLFKFASSFGEKVLGKTSKYTHYGQNADPNPFAGVVVY